MIPDSISDYLTAWLGVGSEQDKARARKKLLLEAERLKRSKGSYMDLEDDPDWLQGLLDRPSESRIDEILLRLAENELEEEKNDMLSNFSENPYAHYLPMDQAPPSPEPDSGLSAKERVARLFASLEDEKNQNKPSLKPTWGGEDVE